MPGSASISTLVGCLQCLCDWKTSNILMVLSEGTYFPFSRITIFSLVNTSSRASWKCSSHGRGWIHECRRLYVFMISFWRGGPSKNKQTNKKPSNFKYCMLLILWTAEIGFGNCNNVLLCFFKKKWLIQQIQASRWSEILPFKF